jgi:modulator of FtsH protease HflC
VLSPDSEFVSELFGAIRAEGLGEVRLDGLDLEGIRRCVPETRISPDLPEAERERIEADQAGEEDVGTN